MSDSIKVTNILENTCLRHSLLAQHGQSIHVNYNGNQYLFDVGEIYKGFKHNFDQMGFSLEEIKGIIISHRHIDHTGSLKELLPQLTNQKIYITDDFGESEEREYSEKYRYFAPTDHETYNIAFDSNLSEQVKSYPNTQIVSEPLEIEPGFFLTGSLGSKMREQSIVFKTEKGCVIVLGCSHPKLPTIIKKAQEITGQNKVYGVIGGFHFKDSSKDEFAQYVEYLSELNPEFLVPGHCTGTNAIQELQLKLGDKVKVAGTGSFGTGNSVELLPELKLNFV